MSNLLMQHHLLSRSMIIPQSEMQDIGGSFYIVLPTTIMLVLLQGKEKKQYSKPLGWPNEKWSSERRLSNDLKVGEIVGGSNFQQQITIDYIYIYLFFSASFSTSNFIRRSSALFGPKTSLSIFKLLHHYQVRVQNHPLTRWCRDSLCRTDRKKWGALD